MKETLNTLNQKRWNACVVNPARKPTFDNVAKKILANKSRYQAVEKATGVPWWFVGVVHYRESSLNWSRGLAQGDPWNVKSTRVPKGRGPFHSWEEAAVDALVKCPPYAAKNTDWSPGGALAMLEKYNGLGYANKGLPSPYVWAGTNQYSKGKYVADHVFDPNYVDRQLGCAGILKSLNVFSKTSVPTVGGTAVVVGGGAVAATHFPIAWVVAGVVGVAALIGIGYLIYKSRKDKTNGTISTSSRSPVGRR